MYWEVPMRKKVAVIMGSDSDLETMKPCIARLKSFDIPVEVRVISAHRTPAAAEQFASAAKENGFGAIIAAAGKAAHLAGVLAAYTTLPVIGVPIKTSLMGGLDSLLSMVQMPKGIPVACVAVDGADNAAILSAQMLALSDSDLADRLTRFKSDMAQEVAQKDQKMQREEF
jgi:5-(carboxyamino)imidazole ribonucleotide mutase